MSENNSRDGPSKTSAWVLTALFESLCSHVSRTLNMFKRNCNTSFYSKQSQNHCRWLNVFKCRAVFCFELPPVSCFLPLTFVFPLKQRKKNSNRREQMKGMRKMRLSAHASFNRLHLHDVLRIKVCIWKWVCNDVFKSLNVVHLSENLHSWMKSRCVVAPCDALTSD